MALSSGPVHPGVSAASITIATVLALSAQSPASNNALAQDLRILRLGGSGTPLLIQIFLIYQAFHRSVSS
jgi:ABC-type arginine/histidine transport system permease subunit